MIKRILVALDPDTDTPVATRHAVAIARRYNATVHGLAVVDLETIASGSRGGGIGSMYYADRLRESLTEETRARAAELIRAFEAEMQAEGVSFVDAVQEGVPFQRIVEDMKYHDLLVMGSDPHYFYGRPKQETDTLAHVIRETVAPTLVVGETYREVTRALVAYDGSEQAARALQSFAQLRPFGDAAVELVHVHQGNASDSELRLRLAAGYLEAHGYTVRTTSLGGEKPADEILSFAGQQGADVIVAGAHSVSRILKLAVGSTTETLIKRSTVPLYLHH